MKAYAAIENGADIILDTVSSHERTAMIEALACTIRIKALREALRSSTETDR